MKQKPNPEADKNQHEVSGNNWGEIRHYYYGAQRDEEELEGANFTIENKSTF